MKEYGKYTYDKGVQGPWMPNDLPPIEVWNPAAGGVIPLPPDVWASAIAPPVEIWTPKPLPLSG